MDPRDEVSTLTDRDERALEAIRRQLDREFPHAPTVVVVTLPATAPAVALPPASLAANAAKRTVSVLAVIGALLLGCVGGGAAGLLLLAWLSPTDRPPFGDELAPMALPARNPRAPIPMLDTRPAPPPAPQPARPVVRERAPVVKAAPPAVVEAAKPATATAPDSELDVLKPASGRAAIAPAPTPALSPLRSVPESP